MDDEPLALQSLEKAICKAIPDCTLACFPSPSKALKYAAENKVDAAFLDIEMGGMNGLELAKKLKDIYSRTNIVFITGYSEYATAAFSVSASDYVLKPVSDTAVTEAMERLRNPIVAKSGKKIQVKTFGNFDIYVDGVSVAFSRSKSKEILAYLIDRRGAGVEKKEMAGILWQDEEYTRSKQFQLQTLISEMMKSLKAVGAEGIILKRHNSLSVDTSKVDCDYYNFNAYDVKAINYYSGEYMTNYSWAEFTLGVLESQCQNI